MGYSGAGGKLIHEKNQKQKSRDTVPLNSSTEKGRSYSKPPISSDNKEVGFLYFSCSMILIFLFGSSVTLLDLF
jgi:hypothetical protein